MEVAPSFAINFPLKVLVAGDSGGKKWVVYKSSGYLGIRHNNPEDLLKNISGIESIVASAAR
jgi:uncharacterized protein (DUF302 family)